MRENLFKPQINQRSDKLAQLKQMHELNNAQDVAVRLYKDAAERVERHIRVSNMLEAEDNSKCTFHPQTQDSSQLKSSFENVSLQEFYSRQEEFLKR